MSADSTEPSALRDRWTALLDNSSPMLRQAPTTVAVACAVALVYAVQGLSVRDGGQLWAGVAVVAGATVMALVFTLRGAAESSLTLLVPVADIVGLALFRVGTGGAASLFSSFILLPVVWIAAAPGVRYVALIAVLTSLAYLMPYFIDAPDNNAEWLRGVISPLVVALVAAVVNELSRLQRARTRWAEKVAAERSQALADNITVVAQLRASERQYRELLAMFRSVWDATIGQAVIAVDSTGLVVAWNPGAARIFGLTDHDAVGRVHIREIFDAHHPDGLAVGFDSRAAAQVDTMLEMADNDLPVERELSLTRNDGASFPARLTVTVRRDGEGIRLGHLLVITDETRAAEVARMKDEFVGMISHELRTPLSSILGYIDLLQDDPEHPLSDEQRQFLAVVERNARRLLRVVGDLLFTAQVDSGSFPLELEDTDLSSLVRAAVESAQPRAKEAGVALIAHTPGDAVRLRVDPTKIGQAIDNLLSNAIKFSPHGARVVLTVEFDDAIAVVRVTDSGMGIPQEELGQLFTRFFRASSATRNAVPGVGLGLTITKAIVTAHGGRVDVTSEEGVGTEFCMTLPRHLEPR